MTETLNYDLGNSGSLSAAPFLMKGITLSITGYLADMVIKRQYYSKTLVSLPHSNTNFKNCSMRLSEIFQVRKFLICGSSVGQTICMVLVGFIIHPVWSIVLLIIGVGIAGIGLSGYS